MTEPDRIKPPSTAELPWVLEALLFVADEPQTLGALARAAGVGDGTARRALEQLTADYEARGLRVMEDGQRYQLVSAPEYAPYVDQMLGTGPGQRLSRAALETLTIIAYRQPCTRAEIEAIRGVDADSALATLLSRKLAKIVGRKDVIGRPLLYGTTRQFLEVFGLKDLAGLPALGEIAAAMPDGVSPGAAGAGEETEETWSGDESASEAEGNAPAEVAGASGAVLAPSGGGVHPGGEGQAERQDGHRPGYPRAAR